MTDTFLIRDVFNPEIAQFLARTIKGEYPSFDQESFLSDVLSDLPNQTYSERKQTTTKALIDYLPTDFAHSISILLKCLPTPYSTDSIQGTAVERFYTSALTAYVSSQGIDQFDLSMGALYKMTKCFTSEWDVRPFIVKYRNEAFELLHTWVEDENAHVRRLVSEGSRPNLPWGTKLKFVDEDPSNTTLPLLSKLQNDPAEYVRKSVANHLNDLSKNNPDLVVAELKKWKKNNYNTNKERLINHALRTLIKKGHKGALKLIGYDSDFDLDVSLHSYDKEVDFVGDFNFSFSVMNNQPHPKKILIDYIIGYQKKDGSIAPKVFKLKKLEIKAGESIEITKKQSFRPISTRVYYPGLHTLSIQINGEVLATKQFELNND